MRLAPVAIKYANLYPNNIRELGQLAEESSIPTHASRDCRKSCRYLGLVLAALINGEDKSVVLSENWIGNEEFKSLDPAVDLVAYLAAGTYKRKTEDQIQGTGWVIASLEAALWCFWNSNSFTEAVLKAVNLGDDADTTGAVCGQLAGAYWGESGIDKELIDGLDRKDMIEAALTSLEVGNVV